MIGLLKNMVLTSKNGNIPASIFNQIIYTDNHTKLSLLKKFVSK